MGTDKLYRVLVKDEDAHEDWVEVIPFKQMTRGELLLWKKLERNLELSAEAGKMKEDLTLYKSILRGAGMGWVI